MFQHRFVNAIPLQSITEGNGIKHYITPEGKSYESVTTYIGRNWDKSFLVKWKERIGEEKANKISKDARDRGTRLHTILEKYLKNQSFDLKDDPTTKDLFLKVKPVLDKVDYIRLIETPLFSDKLQLAGTPDLVSDFCNNNYELELAVLDFKTSTRVKSKIQIVDYFIQTACYAEMYNEHFGTMPTLGVIIIAVPEDPNAVVLTHPMSECLKMLENFRKNPIEFQKKII